MNEFELTLNRKTRMFCSANLRAMHDLEPCPNGITKNGLTLDFTPSFLIQRSGMNSSG